MQMMKAGLLETLSTQEGRTISISGISMMYMRSFCLEIKKYHFEESQQNIRIYNNNNSFMIDMEELTDIHLEDNNTFGKTDIFLKTGEEKFDFIIR